MKKTKYLWHVLLITIILLLLLFSMRFFEDSNQISIFNKFQYTFFTIVIWICEYLILKGITSKTKLSLSIVIGVEVIYDVINYIVRIARGSSITISDIFAIKTGLSVTKNLNLQFDIKFLFGILLLAAIIAVLVLFRKKLIERRETNIERVVKIIIGFIVVFAFSQTDIYKNYSLWDMNETYRTLGSPITVLRMFYDFNVKAPEGYNKEKIKNILGNYENIENNNLEDKPNIIVIVNESFCDYYNLYKDGYADPIEYFTELSRSDNVISGTMYSSEYGGRTSNVEYEFLTQNSLRILPVGSYVFQQYLTKPVNSSIVQNLKVQGYKTHAIHPWENYAYSRNKVYELFGFDSIKFKNDIEGLEESFNNEFFSDKSTYKELMREIEEKQEGEKLFEYVLTVQNHVSYTNPDPKQITYSDENHKNVYMQLIHESAEALEEVINELKQKDEKYILLFFGDHQPNLDDTNDYMEKELDQYKVPFLIWANYDIEEEYNVETSTIYLQNYLLKAAGVKYSSINNYIEELQKYYPVITKRFYMDTDGKLFKTEDNSSENYEKIIEYNKIDYYRIFDSNE